MKYAAQMGSGAMIRDSFRHSTVDGGRGYIYIQIHRQQRDLMSLVSFLLILR
jgi:hypothetical protein